MPGGRKRPDALELEFVNTPTTNKIVTEKSKQQCLPLTSDNKSISFIVESTDLSPVISKNEQKHNKFWFQNCKKTGATNKIKESTAESVPSDKLCKLLDLSKPRRFSKSYRRKGKSEYLYSLSPLSQSDDVLLYPRSEQNAFAQYKGKTISSSFPSIPAATVTTKECSCKENVLYIQKDNVPNMCPKNEDLLTHLESFSLPQPTKFCDQFKSIEQQNTCQSTCKVESEVKSVKVDQKLTNQTSSNTNLKSPRKPIFSDKEAPTPATDTEISRLSHMRRRRSSFYFSGNYFEQLTI